MGRSRKGCTECKAKRRICSVCKQTIAVGRSDCPADSLADTKPHAVTNAQPDALPNSIAHTMMAAWPSPFLTPVPSEVS